MDDLVVLIDRWLKHSRYGVDAYLDLVPRENPGAGDYPRPVVPRIYNDQETPEIIDGNDPPSSPAIVVFFYGDIDLPDTNRNVQIVPSAVVAVAYTTTSYDSVIARRESGYILRATEMSIRKLNDIAASEGYRKLNDTQIAQVKSVKRRRSARGVGKSQVWGFVLATMQVMVPIK